jgi:hypothetical protein
MYQLECEDDWSPCSTETRHTVGTVTTYTHSWHCTSAEEHFTLPEIYLV